MGVLESWEYWMSKGKELNILVFPYRDAYFFSKYGPAVRDLQIILGLSKVRSVRKIHVINRPVSIYERLLNKRTPSYINDDKVETHNSTSWDLIGPIGRRKWLDKCYSEVEYNWFYQADCINVVLDFNPFGSNYIKNIKADYYWYDLIDNFSKHNRFDQRERALVTSKYKWVSQHADLITGVSSGAVESFDKGIVMPNAVGISADDVRGEASPTPKFDFGFIGFLTNKFDVDLVKLLSQSGFSVGIYGDAYDRETATELASLAGVSLMGRFRHDEITKIVGTFKVGLIPYKADKLHDESPLKLYQYIKHGRPVLTSVPFEKSNRYIRSYWGGSDAQILQTARSLVTAWEDPDVRQELIDLIEPTDYWDGKLTNLIEATLFDDLESSE